MAKQKELQLKGKGVAPLHIKELDALAEKYVAERDKRLVMTPREVAAKDALLNAMHKHESKLTQPDGSLLYRYDERKITVQRGKDKVRVETVTVTEHED